MQNIKLSGNKLCDNFAKLVDRACVDMQALESGILTSGGITIKWKHDSPESGITLSNSFIEIIIED